MLASIGGGGLVSGLLSFKKYSNKLYDVYGVEPCDAASMKVSLLNNGVYTLDKIDTFVDISLERFNELYAAAGHPNCVFKINFINLQKITNGQTKDLTE